MISNLRKSTKKNAQNTQKLFQKIISFEKYRLNVNSYFTFFAMEILKKTPKTPKNYFKKLFPSKNTA